MSHHDERLRIWSNMSLPDDALAELRAATSGHELLISPRATASNLKPGQAESAARDADVLIGQPDPADLIASTRVRWAHLTTAGSTRYDRDDLRAALRGRGAVLTNSSAVYADPCAQHVLAFMLAHVRRLSPAMEMQRRRIWDYDALRPAARVLSGQNVVIVGFGAIGRRLAELLVPFGARVSAVRRTVRGDEPVRVVGEDQLNDLLSEANHVANVLPASGSTQKLFDAGRFARMRRGAAFYNVGRGSTVDQDALLEALSDGRLSAAYLDVTSPEPLPPEHPLWTAPNCYITPHLAGGMQAEASQLVRHFAANLGRFVRGESLGDRVI